MRFRRKFFYAPYMIVSVGFLFLLNHSKESRHNQLLHEELEDDSVMQCSPVTKIAFMKTHKCASSTIENILFRHAYRNELNVAIPRVGNYLSMMGLFNRKSVARTPWGKLDMHLFALHNRWNYLEVMRLMGQDTTTFSIVRNPVDLFESLYAYMRMSRRFGISIHKFIELISAKKQDKITNRRINNIYGRNQLAWDLGIGPEHFNNDTYINERIATLNQQFQLVLLVERLEESLVLLRHLLCWPVEHVATLVLNKRKTSKTVKLKLWQRLVLKNWLRADHLIYDFFRKSFDSKVRQFNEEHRHLVSNSSVTPMDAEVAKLRHAVAELKNKCVVDRVGNEKLTGKFHEFSNDIMGYKVKEDVQDCQLYAMSEKAYLTYFRKRMTHRAKEESKARKSKSAARVKV